MKKSLLTSISTLLFLSPLAYAGVVMEMTSKDAAGNETERSKIYAQSTMIRMDDVGGKKDRGLDDLSRRQVFVRRPSETKATSSWMRPCSMRCRRKSAMR